MKANYKMTVAALAGVALGALATMVAGIAGRPRWRKMQFGYAAPSNASMARCMWSRHAMVPN